MKLRILGDSLRLRLSQGDVKALQSSGRIEDTIHFGPTQLSYALELAEVGSPHARFEGHTICVALPRDSARAWAQGDAVSIEATQLLEGERTLSLLIEKDFKCAIPRAGEEGYDGFPHPTQTC